MPKNLYYTPLSQTKELSNSEKLGEVLLKKLGKYPSDVSSSLIPYLEALHDAGIPAAKELIELIKLYTHIQIDKATIANTTEK